MLAGMVHGVVVQIRDRKSTRLNSSHLGISYAVFCLEKMLSAMEEDDRTGRYLNPSYLRPDSGAPGSKQQIRQLSGMRGLMANFFSEMIETPITALSREGLIVL